MYIYPDLRQRMDSRRDGTIFIKIGDVTAIANNIVDEMNAEWADLRVMKDDGSEEGGGKKKAKKFDLSGQRVGRIIRDKFQVFVPPTTGKGFVVEWDEQK